MKSGSDSHTVTAVCDRCGTHLPGPAPEGLCPVCLLITATQATPGGFAGASTTDLSRAPSTAWRTLGHYDLEEEIGGGGMGVVYRARQQGLNRIVAVKLVRGGRFAAPQAAARLRVEAELAARLCHPHIVRILEVGEFEGQPYFSMDLVEGRRLEDLVREHPLPAERAARYLKTVAEAVHYAHRQGVLHRDLKPSNIMINVEDEPRILDFGLARPLAAEGAGLTMSRQLLGSPGFTAPEQAGGERDEVGPAADVYSLGAVLFFLLSGRPPFVADTLAAALRAIQETEPVNLRLLNPSVPTDLATICHACLEKNPARRYATAAALAEDLGRFLRHEPIAARPVGRVGRVVRWCRRRPLIGALTGALGIMTLALLAGGVMAARRVDQSRRLAEREAYVSGIGLARAHLDQGSVDLAMRILTNCPARLRHWEWGHLMRRCHEELAVLNLSPSTNRPRLDLGPGGHRFALINREGTLELWNPLSEARLLRSDPSGAPIRHARFAPRGDCLAVGDAAGRLQLWQTADDSASPPGLPVRVADVAAHAGAVSALEWVADGLQVVTAGADGWIRIWDAATGLQLQEWRSPRTGLSAVWLSPNQDRVIARDELGISTFDRATGALLSQALLPTSDNSRTWPDREGRGWVTLGEDRRLRLRCGDGTTVELIQVRGLGNGTPPQARFSADGRWLCSPGDEATARVWRVADGREQLAIPMRVHDAVFTRDGRLLATLGSHNYAVLWDVEQGRELMRLHGHEAILTAVAFSPDGDRVVTSDQRGEVRVWSTRSDAERLDESNSVWGVEYSPDGRWIAMAGRFEGLTVWEAETGRPQARWGGPPEWIAATAFDPAGQRLVTAGTHRRLRVWEVGTWRWLASLPGHDRTVLGLRFSLDGASLFSYSVDGILQFRDSRSLAVRRVIDTGMNPLFGAAMSPDGTRVAAGNERGEVRLWEVGEGRLLRTLQGHAAQIYGVAFSPDSARLLTSSTDGSVSIWQVGSGRRLASWRARGCEWPIRFDDSGDRLFAGSTRYDFASWDDPRLVVRDALDGRELLSLDGVGMLTGLSYRAADRRLLTGAFEGFARQLEAFPWREAEYPGRHGVDLAFRIDAWGKRHSAARQASMIPATSGKETAQRVEWTWEPDLFPARDTAAGPGQLDLSPFFTAPLDLPFFPTFGPFNGAGDLRELPKGLVRRDGVLLDVRGVIQLRRLDPRGGLFRRGWDRWPRSVRGVPVNTTCRRIHALHGSVFVADPGEVIGTYVCTYVDGQRHTFEIRYGEHVGSDTLGMDPESRDLGAGSPAAPSTSVRRRLPGVAPEIRLSTYENPRPEVAIATLDFESGLTRAAPFLIAMTLE